MTSTHLPHGRDGVLARVVRRAAGASARWRKTTLALWLALVVGCVAAGTITGTEKLTDAQAGVGQSASADARIADAGMKNPAVESILVKSSDPARTRAAAADLQRRAAKLPQVSAVHGPADTPALSTAGGRTVLVQAALRGDPDDAGDNVKPLERTVAAVHADHRGVVLQQAGPGSIDKAVNEVVSDDLQHAEVISIPITLLILVLAFGAIVAASVPLLLGITSVAAALGAVGVISQIAPAGDTTTSLVVLIGLAVGVDYSLFYVRREREERRAGRGSRAALDAAAAAVGRAIVVSGLTVMVALAGLLVTGMKVFESMALATIAVVAIAVIGSLTALPAVLAMLGDRVDKGRIPGVKWLRARRARREAAAGQRRGVWAAIARVSTRRPLAAFVTAVCLLGALAVPAMDMHIAGEGVSDFPPDLPVVQANKAIERSFPGAPEDAKLVVIGHRLGTSAAQEKLEALGGRGMRVTGVHGRVGVDVSRDGRTAVVSVPMPDHGVSAADDTIAALRDRVAPIAAQVQAGAHAQVTGEAARDADFTKRLKDRTPIVIAFVLALAFVLLLAAFRSVPLAAAVIGLNLLSVGAAYGVLVAVFQHSWAESALNFTSNGSIVNWLPLFSFVILFGLSMDYTVLVLERIREARRAGLSPRDAAAEGVGATAGTVTSAAVVMVAIFAVFATLRLLSMKQLGVGLAAAILLDATVVRALALPAAVALLGRHGPRVRPARLRGGQLVEARG
ncbi:MAG TPA: MMPL family transporter [Solirubrobacteraceae bacterium]|nr:MMPL family transporter [Solirubrobacteraceae bacterium]